MGFTALGKRNLQFGYATIVKVKPVWHNRLTVALHCPDEFCHFSLVKQQLAAASWVMIIAIPFEVLGNITIDKPYLALFLSRIAFRDIGL